MVVIRKQWAIFAVFFLVTFLLVQLAGAVEAAPYCSITCSSATLPGSTPPLVAVTVTYPGAVHPLVVLRLKQTPEVDDPAAKAAALAKALQVLLESLPPAEVPEVTLENHTLTFKAGEAVLLQLPSKYAYRLHNTPKGLAQTWQKQLAQLFALPRLVLEKQPLLVPVGERRTFNYLWTGKPPLEVKLTPPSQDCAATLQEGELILEGKVPWEGAVEFSAANLKVQLPAAVRYWAAQLKRQPMAKVSSFDLPEQMLELAASNALCAELSLGPQSKLRLGAPQLVAPHTFSFEVKAEGPKLLPWKQQVEVPCKLVKAPSQFATRLFVSNDPENVEQPGLLCTAKLETHSVSRLLYHHRNASPRPLSFQVELLNCTDAPVQLFGLARWAGPSQHEAYAGHRAVSPFLRDLFDRRGVFFTLPPHRGLVLGRIRTPPDLTSSFLGEFTLLAGGPVYCRVRALAYGAKSPTGAVCLPSPSEEACAKAPLAPAFPASVEKSFEAQLDGKWLFVQVGKKPGVKALDGEHFLPGNYGVLARFDLVVENDSDQSSVVELLHHAGAGWSSATYRIQGLFAELEGVPASQERPLATFVMAPGARRTLTVYTMSEPGSHYPAQFILHKRTSN